MRKSYKSLPDDDDDEETEKQKINKAFTFKNVIGCGAFGKVMCAIDNKTNEEVAIKVQQLTLIYSIFSIILQIIKDHFEKESK